jgi:long-chain acyl-CoA synthetase
MDIIWQILENAESHFRAKVALIGERGPLADRWTYADLREYAERAAALLRRQGFSKGDRVIIWGQNSPEWVVLFLGCMRSGIVAVPLDPQGSSGLAKRVISEAGVSGVYTSESISREAVPDSIPIWHLEDLSEMLRAVSPEPELPYPEGHDIAEIVYTSGTTGTPKGVVLTHRNIAANVDAVLEVVPRREQYRLLSLLPLSHMFEQNAGLLGPLSLGATIVYPHSRSPATIAQTMQEHRTSHMVVVPAVLQVFWAAIERNAARKGQWWLWKSLLRVASTLPSWGRRILFRPVHKYLGGGLEFVISGGAALDINLGQNWEKLGVAVVEGYGTTEAAPVISANSLEERRLGSVGRPLSGVEVKIADDGEILVRGPNITPGYWKNPEANASLFADGWMRTGDLGSLEDGFLYLKGRKKDLIVLPTGMNVHPEDIEDVLNSHPDVKEACVLGMPNESGQLEVHAVLLLRKPEADLWAIVNDANQHLAEYQRVKHASIWPSEDFPRTPTLKVRKRDVEEFLRTHKMPKQEEAAEKPQERPSEGRQARPALQSIVARVAKAPEGEIGSGQTLEGLGLDSLARVQLLSEIEVEMDVAVDESQIGPDTTIGELETLISEGGKPTRGPASLGWFAHPIIRVTRALLQTIVLPMVSLLMPKTVQGLEHVRNLREPVLLAVNHVSHADTPALLSALPWRVRQKVAVAASAEVLVQQGRLWTLVAGLVFNAFPFSQRELVMSTLTHSSRLMDEGWSLLIYPEGRRTETEEIGPFKPGVGFMAVSLRVPVIPVFIGGTKHVLPKYQAVPRRGPVRIAFGEPLMFSRSYSREEATNEVKQAVLRLSQQIITIETRQATPMA